MDDGFIELPAARLLTSASAELTGVYLASMNFSTLEQCLFIMDLLGVNPRKIGSKMQTFIFSFYLVNLFGLIFMVMMLFVKENDMGLLDITDIFNNFLLQMHVSRGL
nr:unnamed protein product [Callosobruchus analis]